MERKAETLEKGAVYYKAHAHFERVSNSV